MSPVEAIVFDLDGVIIDSEAVHHRAYEIALAPFGVDQIPLDIYSEHWSNAGTGLEYAERTWPGVRGPELKARKEAIFLDLLRTEAPLRPGAARAVRELSNRWPIALATGSQRAAALSVLDRFGLRVMFREIVGREDYPNDKPAPDAYEVACRRLGCEPRRCLAIEDSIKGLQAAVQAGMPCIAVPNEYTKAGDFTAAIERLPAMTDLTVSRIERLLRPRG